MCEHALGEREASCAVTTGTAQIRVARQSGYSKCSAEAMDGESMRGVGFDDANREQSHPQRREQCVRQQSRRSSALEGGASRRRRSCQRMGQQRSRRRLFLWLAGAQMHLPTLVGGCDWARWPVPARLSHTRSPANGRRTQRRRAKSAVPSTTRYPTLHWSSKPRFWAKKPRLQP